MADEYQNARGQLKGNTLVKRSRKPHAINGLNNHCDISSRAADTVGIHPVTSKDKTLAENKVYSNNHHHMHKRCHSKSGRVGKSYKSNADRFSRTASILCQAGLMKLTLQIAQLIKNNEDLQREIDELQQEAMEFSENLRNQIQQRLSEQNGNC